MLVRYIRTSGEDNIPVANESPEQQRQERLSMRNIDVEWDDSKTLLREATEGDMAVLLQEETAATGPPVPEKVGKRKFSSKAVRRELD